MPSFQSPRLWWAPIVCAGLIFSTLRVQPAQTQQKGPSSGTTSLTIVVKDSETGNLIDQARLTLQFEEPGGPARFKKPKKLSYSAKTNAQGRYKFTNINKGQINLFVTADGHQSFGKVYTLENDNQVIEVKLKKPQPLL